MSNSKHAFFIPMKLETIVLNTKVKWKDWAGQLADFSLLPHYKKGEHCTLPRIRPNISDDLVSKPFDPTNDPLEAGVHLHWTLPPEFRRAIIQDYGEGKGSPMPEYQTVPNRWLIERRIAQPDGKDLIRRWLLESDALSTKKEKGSCAFPFEAKEPGDTGTPDYRYLGKLYDLDDWLKKGPDPDTRYLDELNATGYGEILFSGYYPECRNVFGFHDELVHTYENGHQLDLKKLADDHQYQLSYQVVGWYSQARQDPMEKASFQFWENETDQLSHDIRYDKVEDSLKAVELGIPETIFFPHLESPLSKDHLNHFDWLVFPIQLPIEENGHHSAIHEKVTNVVSGRAANAVSGKVTDAISGKGLFEVAVMNEEKNMGVMTDFEGNFFLRLPPDYSGYLIFKHKDYQIKQLPYPEDRRVDVQLTPKKQSAPSSIHGKVTDAISGKGLFEVAVMNEEKNMGVMTDFEGNFFLRLPPDYSGYLIFEHKDYLPQRIPYPEDNRVDIQLLPKQNLNGKSLLMGRIKEVTWNSGRQMDPAAEDPVRLVLANTPGQALAALLADQSTKEDKSYASHQIETMLDGLQLGLFNEEEKLDFPARLERGLHTSGFEAVSGERRWNIRREREGEDPNQDPNAPPLPPVQPLWAEKLNQLNQQQSAWDKEEFCIRDRQIQIYADWYKYMLMEYDFTLDEITTEAHVNQIRDYLAEQVKELEKRISQQEKNRKNIEKEAGDLHLLLETWNHNNAFRKVHFQLQLQPGTRYWQPKEPVLLFEGLPAQAVRKTDHLTLVGWANNFFPKLSEKDMVKRCKQFLEETHISTDGSGYKNSKFLSAQDARHTPWHPLYMDWEVEVFPYTKPTDIDFQQKDWPSDAIVANYDLEDNKPDLLLQEKRGSRTGEEKKAVKEKAEEFTKWLKDDQYLNKTGGKRIQAVQGRTFLNSSAASPMIQQIEDQLNRVGKKEEYASLINDLKEMDLLSQRLAGFNDVMLMRKSIMQLPVTDPLARTDILEDFTDRIREVVGKYNSISPLPSNLFMPLREGPFQIRRIRLVDRWGRGRLLEFGAQASSNEVIISEALRVPEAIKERKDNMAYLPPRLVQPARLNFRWLSSEHPSAEAGTHADNSPICGYLVPNFLDKSIHVFNAKGEGLLVMARSGNRVVKTPFPGKGIGAINNPLLKSFIDSIIEEEDQEKASDFLGSFLEAARESTGTNLPENYAQFDGMALLTGRPLALVHAKLDLELRGEAAVNQSWHARETVFFNRENHVHETLEFEKLRFAVRLGDRHRANDGFFAYYIHKSGIPVKELYSPYVSKEPSAADAEDYWKIFSNLKKWKTLESERKAFREKELKSLEKRLPALKSRLDRLEEKKRQLSTSEETEMETLLERINELEELKTGLKNEVDNIQERIEEIENSILSHQETHGYKTTGLGMYRPHNDLLTLSANPEKEKLELGILMDPRSAVHLTTGILPEKRVDIPIELFMDALNNIQIAFLTTPVISPPPVWKPVDPDSDELQLQSFLLPAPTQQGYQWSWLQPGPDEKNEEYPADQIQVPPPGYFFFSEPQIIFDGWMKMNPDQTTDNTTSDE
jgi:hypothetical protein